MHCIVMDGFSPSVTFDDIIRIRIFNTDVPVMSSAVSFTVQYCDLLHSNNENLREFES